jgi:hypothetical protein
MLTLIETSTNLLASDVASRLATDYPSLHAFSMFEFTHLGLVVFLVTGVYLLTVGYWLAPSHVTPRSKLETTQQEVSHRGDRGRYITVRRLDDPGSARGGRLRSERHPTDS